MPGSLAMTMWLPECPSAIQYRCAANGLNGKVAYQIGEELELDVFYGQIYMWEDYYRIRVSCTVVLVVCGR